MTTKAPRPPSADLGALANPPPLPPKYPLPVALRPEACQITEAELETLLEMAEAGQPGIVRRIMAKKSETPK